MFYVKKVRNPDIQVSLIIMIKKEFILALHAAQPFLKAIINIIADQVGQVLIVKLKEM